MGQWRLGSGGAFFNATGGCAMSVFEAPGAGLSLDTDVERKSSDDAFDATADPQDSAPHVNPVSSRSAAKPPSLVDVAARPGPGVPHLRSRTGASEGPRRILTRYSRCARTADLVVAGCAAVLAVTVRLGTTPGEYLLLPVLLPLGWVSAIWLYRAYEH